MSCLPSEPLHPEKQSQREHPERYFQSRRQVKGSPHCLRWLAWLSINSRDGRTALRAFVLQRITALLITTYGNYIKQVCSVLTMEQVPHSGALARAQGTRKFLGCTNEADGPQPLAPEYEHPHLAAAESVLSSLSAVRESTMGSCTLGHAFEATSLPISRPPFCDGPA